jgi:outer membrane protein OmpA-like peptidoglycan-associated protein
VLLIKNSLVLLLLCAACSPVPGPDKSAAGALLGGGMGAGSGAIIGNQVGASGAGIAIGAGMAAAAGLLNGIGMDLEEGSQLSTRRQLEDIQHISEVHRGKLAALEYRDRTELEKGINNPAFLQVFFEEKRASLKLSSVYQLQHLAETLRGKRYGTYYIELKGYSTDLKTSDENKEVIDARLASVKNILVGNGISENYIKLVPSYLRGTKNPEEGIREMESGILIDDRSEPLNRYNNRVELFVKY